jgi:hypothetical protein
MIGSSRPDQPTPILERQAGKRATCLACTNGIARDDRVGQPCAERHNQPRLRGCRWVERLVRHAALFCKRSRSDDALLRCHEMTSLFHTDTSRLLLRPIRIDTRR